MLTKIKNSWRKICGTVAILLIFVMPATRNVIGKIVNLNVNAAGNQNQAQANQKNNNSLESSSSQSVSSVSTPSSASTASPMSNSESSTNSKNKKNKPKHK